MVSDADVCWMKQRQQAGRDAGMSRSQRSTSSREIVQALAPGANLKYVVRCIIPP